MISQSVRDKYMEVTPVLYACYIFIILLNYLLLSSIEYWEYYDI